MTGPGSDLRADLRRLFAAAIEAVDPTYLVGSVLRPRSDSVEVGLPGATAPSVVLRGSVGVFGAGKAAAAMAASFERHCVRAIDLSGVVIAPVGTAQPPGDRIAVLSGEHPVPGPRGEASTRRLRESLVRQAAAPVNAFVGLLSGGASSLLVAPIPPITLTEKQTVTRLLLESGAAIDEVNTVRKHISAVKGGRLLRLVAGRPVISLILSDVVGDDPATIGSGPAVADRSTYGEALAVLSSHGLLGDCPAAVADVLERGRRGEIPDTVRPDSVEGRLAVPLVIGSNATALRAAAAAATALGYAVEVRREPLTGDTTTAARQWFGCVAAAVPGDRPRCFLAGGETTVRVAGPGKGGRNQEFALALVEAMHGCHGAVLSAGSDGVDGPTEAAGAFVDGSSRDRAGALGLDPGAHLRDNDSFRFFEGLGDLFVTGPTGTNVSDLKIALFRPPSAT